MSNLIFNSKNFEKSLSKSTDCLMNDQIFHQKFESENPELSQPYLSYLHSLPKTKESELSLESLNLLPKGKRSESDLSDLPLLFVNEKTRSAILDFLRLKFSGGENGKCLFRRWKQLTCKNRPINVIEHVSPEISKFVLNIDDLDYDKVNRYVEIKYKYFFGITHPNTVREEPNLVKNTPIFLHSNNYSQFDFTINCSVEFSDDNYLCTPVTPMPGDLVFIFISNETMKNYSSIDNVKSLQNIRYINGDKWCIISEQFLRAWTAIMYDNHETFDKWFPANTEEISPFMLREKFLSGSRLMTNSFRKYALARAHFGKDITGNDVKQKFWYLRTEFASRQYVDIYVALVLIAKYGELPCILNVPNNKNDTDVRRLSWDLPYAFISMLFKSVMEEKTCNKDFSIINYEKWSETIGNKIIFTNFRFPNELGFVDIIHNSFNITQGVNSTQGFGVNNNASDVAVNSTRSVNVNNPVKNQKYKPNYHKNKRNIQNRKIIAEHYPEIGESAKFHKSFNKNTFKNDKPWHKKEKNIENSCQLIIKEEETNVKSSSSNFVLQLKIDIPSDWSSVTADDNW